MRALLLGVSAAACVASAGFSESARASEYDALIARHAAANGLPESLVRRVMMKESGGQAHLVHAGNYGLMQIRHGTARGMGYSGSASGLLDPETNMTYAVKYLAGAYRAAGGNQDRAVSLYQRGYYDVAKRQGMTQVASAPVLPVAVASVAVAPVKVAPANVERASVASKPAFTLASAPAAPAAEAKPKLVPVRASFGLPNPWRGGKPLNLLEHVKQAFKPKTMPATEQRQLAKRDDAVQAAEMVRQQTQRDARPDVR